MPTWHNRTHTCRPIEKIKINYDLSEKEPLKGNICPLSDWKSSSLALTNHSASAGVFFFRYTVHLKGRVSFTTDKSDDVMGHKILE